MKVILIGIQGAGKSTQGNLLSKELNIPYLSTGHIFRTIAKEKTKLGRYVKETINAGLLIPDDKVLEIVQNYLSRPEYKKGYILDGFPRTLTQARKFKNGITKVFYLRIPDREALWRLSYRDEMREDETLKAIKKRIELFHKYTKPVIEFYEKKGLLVEIDGTKSIKEVNQAILKSLGKQLIKNQIKEWKNNKKIIIAVVGLPGAGKTEASKFFEKKKKLPVISFGKFLNEYVDKNGLKHTEEVHKKLREEWRKKYGKEAFAILNEDKIREALKKSKIIVVEGMRSWEEYIYLQKKFKDTKMVIVSIFTNKELRYKRLRKRKYRIGLGGRERDINELIGTNMGATIAFADYCIKNNFTLEEFFDKLDEVYREIYFSV